MMLSDKWNFTHGWGNTYVDWGSVLLPENVIQHDNGTVEIRSRYHPEGILGDGGEIAGKMMKYYSGGVMVSKHQFLYGEFDFTGMLPNFRGAWPAYWLYPNVNDGLHAIIYNEIDWFEQFRHSGWWKNFISKFRITSGIICVTEGIDLHTSKDKYFFPHIDSGRKLHIKGIWTEDSVKTYANGKLFFEVTGHEKISHRPMNIIIDQTLGNWDIQLSDYMQNTSLWIYETQYNGESLIK